MGNASFLISQTMFFENNYATYKLVEEVMYVKYKPIFLDLPEAMCIVKDRLELQKGQFMPVLCDIREIKEINKAARAYLSIEGSAFVKAVAFIVGSPISESLSSFYIHTNRPSIPTRSFNNVQEALRFLEAYK